MSPKVETIVIGAGMAGLPMALRAARHGDTVLVEPGNVGGTCLNRGCIPTKTMIHPAKVAHLARRAADFGVDTGPVRVDLASVVARKDRVVSAIRGGSERAVARAEALQLVSAHARFLDAHTVEADGTRIQAHRIIINTETRLALLLGTAKLLTARAASCQGDDDPTNSIRASRPVDRPRARPNQRQRHRNSTGR